MKVGDIIKNKTISRFRIIKEMNDKSYQIPLCNEHGTLLKTDENRDNWFSIGYVIYQYEAIHEYIIKKQIKEFLDSN